MSLDKLEMDLPKYTMKLKDSEMVWWREFITRQRNPYQQPDRTKKWDLDALEILFAKLPQRSLLLLWS